MLGRIRYCERGSQATELYTHATKMRWPENSESEPDPQGGCLK